MIEKFGYVAGNMKNFKKIPEGYTEELLELLFDSANISNFTPTEKIKYDNDMTTARDIANQIEYARDEGIEQGIEQGAAKSRAEIAKAMLADGEEIAKIAKFTGLTSEEIEALKSC